MRKQSLKRKINIQFMTITCSAIFITMVLLTFLFYNLFREEIMDDLSIYTEELKSMGVFDVPKLQLTAGESSQLRITLIEEDGTVIYDNQAEQTVSENHNNRPEVEAARTDGRGQAIRTSQTMNKSTYYYAVLLDNGKILRVAKDAGNVWGIFSKVLPIILGVTLLMLVATIVLSHFFTQSIITPIEQVAKDMEHMECVKTYTELQPFLDTIAGQHADIMKNAKLRQEFTANVSHELKTPLTSISGYAELIATGMATDHDVIRFSNEIHRNSNRLLTLINDIIRLSELDVVDNEPVLEEVDLFQIAQTAVDMLGFSSERHKVGIKMEGEACVLRADKKMMEELTYNLIDNAIRYNKEGGTVRVETKTGEETVSFIVEDTGIGISKENQERIFERFYRVDKSHSKQIGGTGLGLAIVKHIVAKHKAEIKIDSEIGVGTRIEIILHK